MITVTYNDISIECSKALKGSDYVHLLDSSSRIIAAFEKVKDFSAFTISGGKWTTPTVADNCYIAVLGDDGTVQRVIRRPATLQWQRTCTQKNR